jgi:hemoglobin-like flavoprotein
MSASNVHSVRTRLEVVIALAHLLERFERSAAAVSADQYRMVVSRLKAALSEPLPEDALQAILNAHPAAAELYENMHYEHAGLSRSTLERSISSEMLAAQVLARLARGSKTSSAG